MKNISYLLKFGFYLSMLFLAVGLFEGNLYGIDFSSIGIYILVFLPMVFVFFLALFFAYKRDFKKSAVAFALLLILIGNILL